MILFELKKGMPELALAEARAVMHGWGWWDQEDGALFDSDDVPSGLGLTRKIIRVAAACRPEDLKQTLAGMDWDIEGTYRVESNDRELQDIVWNAMDSPCVDLENPEHVIEIAMHEGTAYIGFREWINEERFSRRSAAKLPAPHPSGLKPDVARALVNLACARKVHDPFCGAGGLLIEAALIGCEVTGGDIDSRMAGRAKKNLSGFGLEADVRVLDAREDIPACDAIVTDMPFGKNTRDLNFPRLLDAFLNRAYAATRRIIVGTPTEIDPQDWNVRAHFSQYVHKSMTRHFYVLESKS